MITDKAKQNSLAVANKKGNTFSLEIEAKLLRMIISYWSFCYFFIACNIQYFLRFYIENLQLFLLYLENPPLIGQTDDSYFQYPKTQQHMA